jgi:hypothetical protein
VRNRYGIRPPRHPLVQRTGALETAKVGAPLAGGGDYAAPPDSSVLARTSGPHCGRLRHPLARLEPPLSLRFEILGLLAYGQDRRNALRLPLRGISAHPRGTAQNLSGRAWELVGAGPACGCLCLRWSSFCGGKGGLDVRNRYSISNHRHPRMLTHRRGQESLTWMGWGEGLAWVGIWLRRSSASPAGRCVRVRTIAAPCHAGGTRAL